MPDDAIHTPLLTPTAGQLSLFCGVIAILCLIPLGMMAAGVDLSTGRPALSEELIHGLNNSELTDAVHRSLRGSFTHTILEWTSVCIAIAVCALAFIQFRMMRDPSLLIIGVALACAGAMDAFHTFAADRLIQAVADNKDLIPFTWAICRLFNGVIQLIGVGIFVLWVNKKTKMPVFWIVLISLGFVASAYLIVNYCATSANLPQTMFPQEIISRPYDLYPLIPFLLCGLVIFPLYYRHNPSFFAAALVLSMVPQIATQLYMAFGSTALHDSAFNVAHSLKAVSYLFPAVGLLAVNINAFNQSKLAETALRKNQEMMEGVLSELEDQRLAMDEHAIVSIADIRGDILYANDKFCKLSGYTLEELVGQNHRLVKSDEHHRAFHRDLWKTISGGNIWRGEIKNRAKDGSHYWVDATLVPFKDENGKITQYVAIRTDITAIKESEQDLRASANRATLLHKVGEISEDAQVFEVALQQTLDFTCEILGWQIGHCYLRSSESADRLVPSGIWHIGEDDGHDRFRRVTEQTTFNSGVGLPGRVLATGQVAWIHDVCEDDNFPRNRSISNLSVHGAVAFPVVLDGRIEAVLEFYSDQPMKEDPQMIETLEAVGRYLGVVLERRRASETVRESAQRLNLALVAANQGLWDWNLDDDSTYFNDTWYTMLGYKPGELPMTLETWKQICHPDDLPLALAEVDKYLKGETDNYRCEQRVRMKDGSWKWILDVGEVTERDTHGRPQRMVGVHIDIDQTRANELRIKESERRYKIAVNGSGDGLWDWDLLNDNVYYAPQWRRLLGIGPDETVTDSPEEWTSRIDPRDIGEFMQQFDEHLSGVDKTFEVEMRMIHTYGKTVWMLCRGAVVRDTTGRAVRVAGSMADITEIKESQAELRRLAEHDRLTELPNRELFQKRLKEAIQRTQDNPDFKFAVLFFDFDRFKVINDSLGHKIGDALLVDIALQFEQILRHDDTASRFGGDEFVVLLNGLKDYPEAHQVADRLLKLFAKPHNLQGHSVTSTASIGLVTNEQGYTSADNMIRDADAAMYQAKETGKNQTVVFDKAMHDQAMDRLTLESDLRSAISDDQLLLLYQPIIALDTGELSGFEALVRWKHPQRGTVSPADFIPIAEDTGLIVDIGRWILQTASRQIADWNHRLSPDRVLSMNVNVSKRQLLNPSFVDDVMTCKHQHGLPPKVLKLEITESIISDDRADVVSLLRQLRDQGFPIVMDDFGTGVSSLSTLHDYPIDVLKIDQSFIRVLDRDRSLLAVVASITSLAENLGILTVAEGVETSDIVGALQSIDCTWGQGYHFAKPMTAADAEAYILGMAESKRSA